MDRRALVRLVATGGVAVWLSTNGQTSRKVYRIGILGLGSTSNLSGPEPQGLPPNALLKGMRELGYVYGDNFVTEPRGADSNPERYPELAAELVRLRVDVIVAPGPMLAALKQATATIPIVMVAAADDPVREGLVRSFGDSRGNFTGMSLLATETTGKRLELLKELVPGAAPVAVLWDQDEVGWRAAEAAARPRGWKLLSLEVRNVGAIEAAFQAASDARAGALLVMTNGVLYPEGRRVADLAAKHRLPAMYPLRPLVEAGGLMSYGADIVEIWRHAAIFVDRILKGAKPADLPVEQPTKFEPGINSKTARGLGITIPAALLLRAEVIE